MPWVRIGLVAGIGHLWRHMGGLRAWAVTASPASPPTGAGQLTAADAIITWGSRHPSFARSPSFRAAILAAAAARVNDGR